MLAVHNEHCEMCDLRKDSHFRVLFQTIRVIGVISVTMRDILSRKRRECS